jgi:CRISPR-associated protein Csm3
MPEKDWKKPLYGKIVISGQIVCKTGLHIGSSQDTLQIGGVDLPVIRDPISREPYIPGSSLKGKLRSTLEYKEGKEFNRNVGMGIYIHVCENNEKAYNCPVCRIFGATAERGETGDNFPARLIVRDCHLANREEIEEGGVIVTEIKFENNLDRITAAANPRQIERVPAGAKFGFELIYNVEAQSTKANPNPVFEPEHLKIDLKNLLAAMKLVEFDALGGHGSRGYGKIEFSIEQFAGYKVDYYIEPKPESRAGLEKTGEVYSFNKCTEQIDKIAQKFEEAAKNVVSNQVEI